MTSLKLLTCFWSISGRCPHSSSLCQSRYRMISELKMDSESSAPSASPTSWLYSLHTCHMIAAWSQHELGLLIGLGIVWKKSCVMSRCFVTCPPPPHVFMAITFPTCSALISSALRYFMTLSSCSVENCRLVYRSILSTFWSIAFILSPIPWVSIRIRANWTGKGIKRTAEEVLT